MQEVEDVNNNKFDIHEIKIKIDEYINVTLKLPKVMTAMQFKAILSKSNSLLKLSDVRIKSIDDNDGENTRQKQPVAVRKKYIQTKWTPEMEKWILKNPNNLDTQKLVDEVNSKFNVSIDKSRLWSRKFMLTHRK